MLMQLLITLTIGLHFGARSLLWIIPLPPIFFILAFKVYTSRTFSPDFRYYIPTEEELRQAHIHSQRADSAGNRLGKRFGHPALHQELFTPMVHEDMTALLSEVYKGKISNAQTKLKEYGGTEVDAHVVAGGIRIAGIAQVSLWWARSYVLLHANTMFSAIWSMILRCINVTAETTGTRALSPPRTYWRAASPNMLVVVRLRRRRRCSTTTSTSRRVPKRISR